MTNRRRPPAETSPSVRSTGDFGSVRIIGGKLRGRTIPLADQSPTRPMKDRTREAVFNLVADSVKGRLAVDLFAGTGVLGFEALSRGAARALLLERHFPTARQIQRSAQELGVEDRVQVYPADAFIWLRRLAEHTLSDDEGRPLELLPELQSLPWVVFFSPPYDYFIQRQADCLRVIEALWQIAPPDSILVVESDERFDPERLPRPDAWIARTYAPAIISIAWTNP
ncbi:MAG TPA: RsmD family RNA methyltransferase [Pirellulaceae bacterium]|nr:RsmD family RNA methyltransferase [Pirellulaceae bacterium]